MSLSRSICFMSSFHSFTLHLSLTLSLSLSLVRCFFVLLTPVWRAVEMWTNARNRDLVMECEIIYRCVNVIIVSTQSPIGLDTPSFTFI